MTPDDITPDDIDKLLKRRLFLQRYVTSLFNDLVKLMHVGDRAIVLAVNDFVQDADVSLLAALGLQKVSNPVVKRFIGDIKGIVADQAKLADDHIALQINELIPQEMEVTAKAIGLKKIPKGRGVAGYAVGGSEPRLVLRDAFGRYRKRLIGDIANTAKTNPSKIVQAVRGTRAQNYKDGVLKWRNDRVIRPNVDTMVNATATNAQQETFKAFEVKKLRWSATLDYRTCPTCIFLEDGSPYDIFAAPDNPAHVACRCVLVPWVSDESRYNERGYFKSDQSYGKMGPGKVKGKDQRDALAGRTRIGIVEFFNRMSKADRVRYMGPTRAKLWDEGKIDSIRDLVNKSNGQPLTLDQLPKP